MRILIALAFLVAVALLQVFLSRRGNGWPGLIIPSISFVIGLLYPLSLVVLEDAITIGFLFRLLVVWLLGNIPTFLFLAIYFGCQAKNRHIK